MPSPTPAPLDPPTSEALAAWVRRLAPPADLYHGRSGGGLVLPDNLVCFTRHSLKQLNGLHRGDHFHHRFVLAHALRGGGQVSLNARPMPLAEGHCVLVFPHQSHWYTHVERSRIDWLFVTFEAESGAAWESLRNQPLALDATDLAALARVVEAWNGIDTPGRTRGMRLELALMLERLCRRVAPWARVRAKPQETELLTPGGAPHDPEGDRLLERVNHYLNQRLREPFGIKEMSRDLGLSEGHLRARFRSLLGLSLGHYLRRMRMHRACELLRGDRLSVTQVAGETGFRSVYAFSRAFRQVVGETAQGYRLRLRRNPVPGVQAISAAESSTDSGRARARASRSSSSLRGLER